MRCLSSMPRAVRAILGSASSAIALAGSFTVQPDSALAQTTTLPNPTSGVIFQTSGPARCANIGDWYTTYGNFNNTGPGGTVINGPIGAGGVLCSPGDPIGNQTTNPTSNKLHRFLINVTPDDLARSGGAVTVIINDAGTCGLLDEVDGFLNGGNIGSNPPTPNCDPTRFRLLAPSGTIIGEISLTTAQNLASLGVSQNLGLGTITAPGVYTVTSETGEYPINGFTGPFNPQFNNDDNGFQITVNGVQDLLIGQFQGTFQNRVFPSPPINFFFLVGPGTTNVFIRNFDLDNDGTISYASPTAAGIAGTVSGNAGWNGGGTLNTGGDSQVVNGIGNAGRWGISLNGYGATFVNQSLLEVAPGNAPPDPNNPNSRLPVLDTIPRRAGNFTITTSTDLSTQIGQTVCHPFTVTNNFFTTDIVNLTTNGTDPNYTVQFRDAAGTTPLTDTDGNGTPDTGILAALGGSGNFTLCVTPKDGAPLVDTTIISGTSFMDRRVREQAVQSGAIPPDQATPIPQTVTKITRIGAGGSSSLRLVKRITNVTRNGVPLPGVNFGAIADDPNDPNDNAPGFSQLPLTGVLALDVNNPVRSNDEVTYTVYFLADGSTPSLGASICDLIPGGTTFSQGSLEVKSANDPVRSDSNFFTPLAPLPANNSCPIQTNPNGAAIFNLGDIPNNAGSNFGFVRFRVRVN